MVYRKVLGSNPVTVWLKYLWQMVDTFRLLHRERTDVAFAMTPPLFAGLTLYVYSLVRPLKYVIDVHTAALMMPRWKRLQWLQAFVCRHAVTTLVTNDYLAAIVRRGGGHTTIVRDVPVVYPISQTFSNPERFTIAVVCSFNYDEPIAEILKAAGQSSDVQFYVTGDHSRLSADLLANAPLNVKFTGFLSPADYGSLLTHANAVMSLTTRDHTMLRGAYEAIYLGSPVVVSNWPLLHGAFDSGAVHVDCNADDIARGIREMRMQISKYERGAIDLRTKKLREWNEAKALILARLTETASR